METDSLSWNTITNKVLEKHKLAWVIMTCWKHKEEPICDCGANTMCFECGEGHGQLPCKCHPDFYPSDYVIKI